MAGVGTPEAPVDRATDVIVIGLGAAGLATAITAHDAGAEVLILEKMPQEKAGGSSRVSGGSWYSPADPDEAATYLRNLCGEYALPEELVTAWSREVVHNTSWMKSLGIDIGIRVFDTEFPEVEGSASDLGWYNVMPSSGYSHLWRTLSGIAVARGIEVLYDTRAIRLVQQGSSREVTGVIVDQAGTSLHLSARRGVVLASGGFSNNAQLARDFLRLPSVHPRGSPGATGDGLLMAERAGAGLWHMHNYCGAFGIKVPEYETSLDIAMPANGWIYVDTDGRRFMDEMTVWRHGKVRAGNGFRLFPDRVHHCVFDETTRLAGPLHPPERPPRTSWNRLVDGYEWSADNSDEIAKGWIASGETIAELAATIGVEASALEHSVAEYNAACVAAKDIHFGRAPTTLKPIRRAPFYAWTWGQIVTFTNGGPMKDGRGRVLDASGAPIPRLYAAGEVSSTYSWTASGGLMIGDCLVFGRISGRGVAAEPARQK